MSDELPAQTQKVGGAVTTAAPTYATGTNGALSLTTGGGLRVAVTSGGGSEVAQSSTTAGELGPLCQAAVTTASPTYVSGQTNPLSLDTAGSLRVNVVTGAGTNNSVSTTGSTTPASATLAGGTVSAGAPSYSAGNLGALSLDTAGSLRVLTSGTATVSGTVAVSNSFALDASVTGLQVAQASTTSGQSGELQQGATTTAAPSYTTGKTNPLSLTTAGDLRAVLSNAFALDATLTGGTQQSKITDGSRVATVKAASTAAVATDLGLVVALSPNNAVLPTALGQATAANSLPVVLPSNMSLATSGGASISRTLSANNTTAITIKGSAGQLYGIHASNTNASARFVKIYNSTTASVGNTTPVMTLVIPGNSVGAGVVLMLPCGIAFATGIQAGITGLIADNDTTAPAANEVVLHAFYA